MIYVICKQQINKVHKLIIDLKINCCYDLTKTGPCKKTEPSNKDCRKRLFSLIIPNGEYEENKRSANSCKRLSYFGIVDK